MRLPEQISQSAYSRWTLGPRAHPLQPEVSSLVNALARSDHLLTRRAIFIESQPQPTLPRTAVASAVAVAGLQNARAKAHTWIGLNPTSSLTLFFGGLSVWTLWLLNGASLGPLSALLITLGLLIALGGRRVRRCVRPRTLCLHSVWRSCLVVISLTAFWSFDHRRQLGIRKPFVPLDSEAALVNFYAPGLIQRQPAIYGLNPRIGGVKNLVELAHTLTLLGRATSLNLPPLSVEAIKFAESWNLLSNSYDLSASRLQLGTSTDLYRGLALLRLDTLSSGHRALSRSTELWLSGATPAMSELIED